MKIFAFSLAKRLPLVLPLGIFLSLFGSCVSQAGTSYFLGNGNTAPTRQWNSATVWSPNPSGGGNNVLPNFTTAPVDDLVFGNYHASEVTLNTRNTPGTFYANSITFTCNGWIMVVNAATDKLVLGAGGITNNIGNITGAPTGTANNPSINAIRNYIELGANATIYNGDTNQQLTIRQDPTDFAAGNGYCLDNKGFTLTFDGPGTNVFTAPTAGSHAGGAIKGTGGVIKNGIGLTTFSATNTYTGSTVVNAGQLSVTTWSSGGGSYTVADGATLGVKVGSAGTTLNVPSLNITNVTTTNSLLLGLSSLGNPTAPLIYATNFILNGTVYVSITGSGFSPGTISLIQYNGSIQGGGTLVANPLPAGLGAYLTNNASAKQIQLVVVSVPSLVWIGKTNTTLVGTWDTGITANWLDGIALQPTAFANGLPVQFDDTGFTNLVTLAATVTPFSITVSNSAKTFTLTNDGISGFQANPSRGVIKDGPGKFILATSNSYTGFTYIKQGTLQAAAANAIGRGPGQAGAALTNYGILDLNGFSQNIGALNGSGLITNSSATPVTIQSQTAGDGGTFTGRIDEGISGGQLTFNKSGGTLTLSGNNNYSGGTVFVSGGAAASRWIILGGNNVLGTGPLAWNVNSTLTADANARSLTNSIFFNTSATFGNTGAGLLACSGPITLQSGVDQSLTFNSDVVFSGPLASGSLLVGGFQTKDGPGTLRFLNNTGSLIQVAADLRINDGSIIIDGAALSIAGATAPNFRVQSQVANGLASLVITNNGSLTVGNINGYYRLRLGDTTSASGSTNIVDVRGTLTADGVTLGYTSTGSGGGNLARLNLQNGSQAVLNQISTSSSNSTTITEVNLDGATITAPDGASSSFLEGLTSVFIRAGGVTLNGANTNSIHIRQNLLNGGGGGGLIWNGTNALAATATALQLDGINTYTGTTLINIGMLGGTGLLVGPLVLASGSSLSPGGDNNISTFTVNNNVTISNGVHLSFELNTTNALYQTDVFGVVTNVVPLATNDLLVVSGALNINGANLTVTNSGTNLVAGNNFKLFNKGVTGFFSVSLPALDSGLTWQNNLAVDGSITVVAASVTPPILAVSHSGNILTFTWTDGSFHLQSQTNAVNVGLSTNWFDYPGGGTSGVNVTNNPVNPSVFFRLSQ